MPPPMFLLIPFLSMKGIDNTMSSQLPKYVEDIHQDAWHWRAHYDDVADPTHETLDEYDPGTGVARGFASIDLTRLVQFELVPQRHGLGRHVLVVSPQDTMRPIFFRRRAITVTMVSGALVTAPDMQLPGAAITVLGWQRTIGNGSRAKNVKSFTFLLEDGGIVVSDHTDAVNWGEGLDGPVPVVTPATPAAIPAPVPAPVSA